VAAPVRFTLPSAATDPRAALGIDQPKSYSGECARTFAGSDRRSNARVPQSHCYRAAKSVALTGTGSRRDFPDDASEIRA
jgi:hypothetical protein